MNSFSGYKELPVLTSWGYIVTAFIGRMPTAMTVIGVLTLVTSVTGSVGKASLASASLAIATGIANPTIGRLTDKYGQRLPLLAIIPVNIVALLTLVFLIRADSAQWLIMALTAVIGATTAPVGALARVRWYPIAREPRQIAAAMSWESVADEMAFVLGPAAVGLLAAGISVRAPLIAAALIVATCVLPFALSRFSVGPSIDLNGDKAPAIRRVLFAVRTPLLAMLGLGMFFGAMQTAVTAFAHAAGTPGNAGLIYATMGLSAAITALGSVAFAERYTLVMRIVVGGLSIALAAALCILATDSLILAIIVFVCGLGIGPASVAIFTLVGQRAPRGGDAVAVTAIGSINVLGVAASSSITGQVVEQSVAGGFLIAAGCGLFMALAAFFTSVRQEPA